MLHQYKITAYSDIGGSRSEVAFQYADGPMQALSIYDNYSKEKDEQGNYVHSLVTMSTCVYKTVGISDFRKIYQA